MQAPPSNGTVEVCEGYVVVVTYKRQSERYVVFSESELRLKLEELHQEVKIVDPETKEEVQGIDKIMLDTMNERITEAGGLYLYRMNSWRSSVTDVEVLISGPQNLALRWDMAKVNEKPFNVEGTNTKSASKH